MPDDNWFDRAMAWYVTKFSGRVVAITAVLLYPILGLLVPVVLGWPMVWLINVNLVGVSLAALVSLAWLFEQVRANNRRRLLEWTSNLRLLSAEEFEWLVGEMYRREGWIVRERGSQDGADGNIDLELTRGSEHRLVQCKRWESRRVGVNDIRSFAGALMREGTDAGHGDFVTLSSFNVHAESEAQKLGMTIVDGRELYERVDRVRRSEPCPVCGRGMLLDRSPRGWWLRCTAPGCSGKRHLDSDPGRAMDMLITPPPPEPV